MKIKNIFYSLIFIFFILTVLLPVSILNKVIFIGIILTVLLKIRSTNKLITLSPFIIASIFLFGFIVSFLGEADRSLSIQFMFSVFLLFLIYPIHRYNIDMDRIVKFTGIILSLYTGISFLAVVVFPANPFSSQLATVFRVYSAGSYGLRDFTEEATLSFHVGAVPFLYLPFLLFFFSFLKNRKKVNLLGMVVIFPAIVASASRGLIGVSLMSLVIVYFLSLKLPTKLMFTFISIPFAISLFLSLASNTTIFSSEEVSNSVKIGHFTSFLENINVWNFFVGNGLASYYFSSGVGQMVAHTEITPLDMFRFFGFLLTPILYLAILFPSRRISAYWVDNRYVFVAFVLYLINSMTNPIMFNSYGLLIVLWYWSKILDSNETPAVDYFPMVKYKFDTGLK